MRQRRRVPSLSRYADNPLGYASDVLKIKLWAKQEEIALSVRDNPRTLVRSAFGVGKTFVAAALVKGGRTGTGG